MPPRRTRRLPPQNGPGCFPPAIPGHAALWPHPARPRWPWDAAHRRAWKIPAGTARPRPGGPAGTGTGSRRRAQAPGTCCRAGASPAPADQRPRQTGAPANSPAPQGTPAVVGGRENLPEARPASKTPAQRTGRCACSPSRRTARHSPLPVRAAVLQGHTSCLPKAPPDTARRTRPPPRRGAGSAAARTPPALPAARRAGTTGDKTCRPAQRPAQAPPARFSQGNSPHTASRAGTARCRPHTERPSFSKSGARRAKASGTAGRGAQAPPAEKIRLP